MDRHLRDRVSSEEPCKARVLVVMMMGHMIIAAISAV